MLLGFPVQGFGSMKNKSYVNTEIAQLPQSAGDPIGCLEVLVFSVVSEQHDHLRLMSFQMVFLCSLKKIFNEKCVGTLLK